MNSEQGKQNCFLQLDGEKKETKRKRKKRGSGFPTCSWTVSRKRKSGREWVCRKTRGTGRKVNGDLGRRLWPCVVGWVRGGRKLSLCYSKKIMRVEGFFFLLKPGLPLEYLKYPETPSVTFHFLRFFRVSVILRYCVPVARFSSAIAAAIAIQFNKPKVLIS